MSTSIVSSLQCGEHANPENSSTGRAAECQKCQPSILEVPPAQSAVKGQIEADTKRASGANVAKTLITVICLVSVGLLAPFAIVLASTLTVVFGPIAIVSAPLVAILVSRILADCCLRRVGRRWFWLYAAVAFFTFTIQIVPAIVSHHANRSQIDPTTEGTTTAMYATGMRPLLMVVCGIMWLLGTALTVTGEKNRTAQVVNNKADVGTMEEGSGR